MKDRVKGIFQNKMKVFKEVENRRIKIGNIQNRVKMFDI